MSRYPREFWHALQTGVEVAAAGPGSQKLLGIRDGFVHFLRHRFDAGAPVILVPQEVEITDGRLPLSDEATLDLALEHAAELERRLGDAYLFYAVAEGGLDTLEVGGRSRYVVRYWTALRSPLGEAIGASGGLQLPDSLLGGLDEGGEPAMFPGTRRQGGMLGSLTAGLETQRSAVATATFNALSTLFFGVLDGSAAQPRRRGHPLEP